MGDRLTHLQILEWPDSGHFVHLAHVERFATWIRSFARECSQTPTQ
jgi:hypothetical protein